jgi:hypothetical protein
MLGPSSAVKQLKVYMKKNILFFGLLISTVSFAAEGELSCVEKSDFHKLLDHLKPLTSENPLAARKTNCIETVMPSKKSETYEQDLEVLKKPQDIRSDGYMYPWLYVKATESSEEKIKTLYEVSAQYDIPPAVLYGAIAQESGWMEMGLAEDYGNWACGLAQLNANDWCGWASHAGPEIQARIQWPKKEVEAFQKSHPKVDVCDSDFLVPEHARPFYDVALKRLRTELPDAPEYMLEGRHAKNPQVASFEEVQVGLGKVTATLPGNKTLAAQKIRYSIVASFAGNCSAYENGVPAGAYTFQQAFKDLPKELQNAQRYKSGEKNPNLCQANPSQYYPLHVGWLLANAVYNAGPEILPGVYQYQKNSGISWENFTPENLVSAIQFSLSQKDNGLSAIGAQEAKGHVPGVLYSTSQTPID